MDRYPGYESMLTRVEHMKMQVKAQLAPEQSHLVDDLVDFVLDRVDECCNVPTVDAATDTTEDYPLSDEPVTRGAIADDTRIDVIGQANPQVDHQHEGSISSGQTVSRRCDEWIKLLGMGQFGSPSRNVIPINVEYVDDQVATSSTTPITIEDNTQPSQTVPLPTQMVTPTQSSIGQLVNEPLRDESLNGEPRIDNVALVVHLGAEEFDRDQVDEGDSTLNPMRTDQDDEEEEKEGDETIEERDAPSAGDEQQVQVPAENFVKLIETDERGYRFECDYRGCGKRTKRKWDLVLHIRTHTGEMRFKCTVAGCDRAFVQKCHLDEHTRTHTGERPFECDQCDATFIQHSHLVTHLRIHTGERPFICTWPECGQVFISSSHLKTHSLVHSNARQFVCDVTGCTKVYKHMNALRRHQKEKHN